MAPAPAVDRRVGPDDEIACGRRLVPFAHIPVACAEHADTTTLDELIHIREGVVHGLGRDEFVLREELQVLDCGLGHLGPVDHDLTVLVDEGMCDAAAIDQQVDAAAGDGRCVAGLHRDAERVVLAVAVGVVLLELLANAKRIAPGLRGIPRLRP